MAKPKVKVSEVRLFRIRKDLCERLDGYSETSHIPKTIIVEFALEKYLDDVVPVKKTTKKKLKK